jgi:GntR family transcriptional regulator
MAQERSMMLARLTRKLDRADGKLYRQVAARLRRSIVAGRIAVGAELPTEAALAGGFGVSLITVRHALRELQAEGLIEKRPAKPAVVTSTEPSGPAARRMNSLDDIAAAAEGAALEISEWRPARAAAAARVFGLDPATELPCLRGRVVRAGVPMSDVTIYFPPAIGARLTRRDFDDVVVFRAVQRHLGLRISGARVTVRAELADAALARRLEYDVGAAVLVSEIVYLDDAGQPAEFTVARHRGDAYSLSYAFSAE